jgi:hypothetical protein
MHVKFNHSLLLPMAAAVIMLGATDSLSQTVEIVQVSKTIQYVQTNATTAVVGPIQTSPGYGGPYGFSADVLGTNIGNISPPALELASGSTFDDPENFDGYLAYNSDGGFPPYSSLWAFGLVSSNDWGAESQEEIDTLFANGTYTFTVQGRTIPLNLTGNVYPNTPIATLTGGSWRGCQYVMDASNALTITTSVFTNYADYVDGRITIITTSGYSAMCSHSSDPSSDSLTYTLPANSLDSGQSYPLSFGIAFDSFVDTNADLPGSYNCAYYDVATMFTIVTVPHLCIHDLGANMLKISFTGIIQQSSDLKTWTDVYPQSASPWFTAIGSGACFFRVRSD